jgi:hypothetical protein
VVALYKGGIRARTGVFYIAGQQLAIIIRRANKPGCRSSGDIHREGVFDEWDHRGGSGYSRQESCDRYVAVLKPDGKMKLSVFGSLVFPMDGAI